MTRNKATQRRITELWLERHREAAERVLADLAGRSLQGASPAAVAAEFIRAGLTRVAMNLLKPSVVLRGRQAEAGKGTAKRRGANPKAVYEFIFPKLTKGYTKDAYDRAAKHFTISADRAAKIFHRERRRLAAQ